MFYIYKHHTVLMKAKRNEKSLRFLGLSGFLGFLGFLFFIFKQPFFLALFSLFSGFSFWGWAKFANDIEDERFLLNKFKAFQISIRIGSSMVFVAMMFLITFFSHLNNFVKYTTLIAIISLSFSVVNILFAYLTNKYENR